MALGHDGTMFILAFDHRGSFKKMFGATDATPEQMEQLKQAKSLVYEGFKHALELGVPRDQAGVLVDEEMGEAVARDAAANGFQFAMPVEKSGQNVFDFEYGDDFGKHIDDFDPTWSKVLVRWNPADVAENEEQAPRLKRLGDWLHANGRKYLFELLVPATDADLASVDGDKGRYDTEVRPDLTITAIEQILAAGIEPDIWKIEGLDDRADCQRLASLIRTGEGPDGSRAGVVAVVLGRGADNAKVDHWLEQGAPVEGYAGFAIGRSIWTAGVEAWRNGDLSREEAAAQIGANFKRFVDVYTKAQ